MAKTRVLITVKTYPAISKKYEELVCTAGFKEDGTWIRIYPIQFRKKSYSQQYSKYQWIELDLVKNTSDFRPESFRPYSHETPIELVGEIKSDGDAWYERRKIVLKKVYTEFNPLIEEAKNKAVCTSLAVYKPTEIFDFVYEEESVREWTSDKLEQFNQFNLFDDVTETKANIVRKLPYKFSYIFKDEKGKQRKLMIEDWETGQLFWNCLKRYDGNESKACDLVRQKYFDDFYKTKDLFFFLGTTKTNHFRAPNPFVIIGTFHPKPITQPRLF
jgi:hypothetical protein